MKNFEKLWTTDGLLLDKNGDGVIDGVSLHVALPEGLRPLGLLDFFARLGLETTAISYDFFGNSGQKVVMEFIEAAGAAHARFEENRLSCFYENENDLSALLSEIAGHDSDIIIEEKEIPLNHIRSLADIWSFSGFGAFDEATPQHDLSLNIQMEEAVVTSELFRELCHFAARCGLYSTSLNLPLTGNDQARIHFHVASGEETRLRLLQTNQIELSGTQAGCAQALKTLNNSRHWSQQGDFGYWEQELILNDKKEAELWYENSWEDVSERELVMRELAKLEQLPEDFQIYLSEPLEIRQDFAKELQAKFPSINTIKVRSAFKTGFHWIREELLPELDPDITEIHISVRKEASDDGLELPIRWIQELYPIDGMIEKSGKIKSKDVNFYLKDHQQFTYQVEGIYEDGTRKLLGRLEVPIAKMPYVTSNQFAYPSTGAVRLQHEGIVANDILIPTDRERFYLHYLQEFLPNLKNKLAGYNEGQGRTRPFFDRIEIDVTLSEEEEKLHVDEERTSSSEALYEDLYFNTLDYFAEWGIELEGKAFDAPGGVHPFIHVKKGASPSASIRVYKWEDRELADWRTLQIDFDTKGELASATLAAGDREVTVPTGTRPELPHADSPGARTILADHSYQGRQVPLLEYYLASGETFDSPIKLTLFKKTLVIEAGHHANEISSTPAVLKLLENADDYLKDVNIVVIPNANPDGYALLQKMVEEHPEWKHHAARYNAVGLEFAHVRYQKTIFGEANVLPLIMKKWAPDVIVDDHGIPAHEWVQPFAGYNSPPRFPVSYFLPSAKIYGIGRISDGANKSLHAQNLEAVVLAVSGSLAGSPAAEQNEYWKERFTKYGHQWLPEVFPLEEAPHMNFYRMTSVTPQYPTVSIQRYPEWVAADVISEAADEVVYGDSLEGCIEAHILFNRGILKLLKEQGIQTDARGLNKSRVRPIRF
ncbi:M14 family metallopeptidase [Planococcus sp. X10-3]|uniref:M14 family metallopeptidase n=1 Tax=Planococcus sp. X10-3 TaxID=3061240 RepID=UPI003BB16BC7